MGIFDKIKTAYQKVDTALGGYLPGGSTPSQVAATKTPVAPSTAPTNRTYNPLTPAINVATNTSPISTSSTSSGSSTYRPSSTSQAGPTISNLNRATSTQETLAAIDQAANQVPTTNEEGIQQVGTEQFKYSFTPEQAEGIATGQFEAPADMKEAILAGQYNRVQDIKQTTPVLTTGITGLGSIGTLGKKAVGGKVLSLFDKLKNLKSSRVVAETIVKAERQGSLIDSVGGLIKPGVKLGGITVKNTKQSKALNGIIINSAKKISPTNWKTLLGLTSTATAAAGISIWSGFGVRNSYSDTQQQLGFMENNALDDGNMELADEIATLRDENTAYYNELKSKIFSTPWGAVVGIKNFVDLTREATDLRRASIEEANDKQAAIDELQERIFDGGQLSAEEQAFLNENKNQFQVEEDLQDMQEQLIDTQRLAQGQAIADRILSQAMTAEEIYNDPEIRSFALDPNNQFTAVTKLWTEAQTATGRTNFFGEEGSTGGYTNEAPSTLGFGLLQTGGEQKYEDTQEEDIQAVNLNSVAVDLYGVPYSELTPAQKAVVDKKEI